ncbi:MAG: hypothetical protein IJQ79_03130 [Bacteroidales bacterium]|nr:hypothetical protein [Bacteroidales bacterium]
MRQQQLNRYRELCNTICEVLTDTYEDDGRESYPFAVNPATFEVVAVGSEAATPDGWIFESIPNLEWTSIEECAQQYFDFRR